MFRLSAVRPLPALSHRLYGLFSPRFFSSSPPPPSGVFQLAELSLFEFSLLDPQSTVLSALPVLSAAALQNPAQFAATRSSADSGVFLVSRATLAALRKSNGATGELGQTQNQAALEGATKISSATAEEENSLVNPSSSPALQSPPLPPGVSIAAIRAAANAAGNSSALTTIHSNSKFPSINSVMKKDSAAEILPKPVELRPLTPMEFRFFELSIRGDFQGVENLMRESGKEGEIPLDVNIPHPNSGGATVLHFAALYNHAELIEFFLARGAAINATSSNFSTPLHWACGSGSLEAVEYLLSRGADPLMRSVTWSRSLFGKGSGQSAFHWAAESGHKEILEVLHAHQPLGILSSDERQQRPVDLSEKDLKFSCTKFLQLAEEEEYFPIKIQWKGKIQKTIYKEK